MATLEPSVFSAVFRVEGAVQWHPELTRVLGFPDTCLNEQTGAGDGSVWAMESPYTRTGADEPLKWANDLINTHETLIARLLADGGRVVVHLACDCNGQQAVFRVAPYLLGLFVRMNIPVEFGACFTGGPIP